MAKQGQHNNDARDSNRSRGHNNPDKSATITTGAPEKHETYERTAYRHEDTGRQAQAAKNDWDPDTRDQPSIENSTRARNSDINSGRSGGDSNASPEMRGEG